MPIPSRGKVHRTSPALFPGTVLATLPGMDVAGGKSGLPPPWKPEKWNKVIVKELKGKGSKRQEENVLPKFQNFLELFNPVTDTTPLFTQAQPHFP